ncbi:MAG: hypothetical protein IPK12_00895 [Gemmatimonadetes bacterium]|nr:hypothetical protein [Gemmatimonadota bacterium]
MNRAALLVALGVLGTVPLAAQVTLRADAALGSTAPTPTARRLWAVGGEAEWLRPAFRLLAEGEYREFGRGDRGSFGRLAGSWYRPVAAPVTLELTGEASGLTHPGREAMGVLLGGARFHVHGQGRGLWFGSQAGRDAVGSVVRWEGAAWQRFGALTVQLQGSQTASRELERTRSVDTLGLAPDSTREAQRVRTDVGAWLGWHAGALEVSGALGRRFGVTEPAGGLGHGRRARPAAGRHAGGDLVDARGALVAHQHHWPGGGGRLPAAGRVAPDAGRTVREIRPDGDAAARASPRERRRLPAPHAGAGERPGHHAPGGRFGGVPPGGAPGSTGGADGRLHPLDARAAPWPPGPATGCSRPASCPGATASTSAWTAAPGNRRRGSRRWRTSSGGSRGSS